MMDLAAMSQLRVWFVHDWLTGWRGGEKVLFELVRMFPKSRIATLVHVPGSTHADLDRRVQRVSFLQKMPGVKKGWRNYLPLFPRAVRSLQLDDQCDLVISVSHAVAKGIAVPRRPDGTQIPHVCFCNTPMRYIWGLEDQYVSKWNWKAFALKTVKPYLRRFDKKNAEVTAFVSNSDTVAERIKRIYNREAVTVYPGADDIFYVLGQPPKRDDFYLVVSALVPYKRVDLAVQLFATTPDKRLVVIGKGPEMDRLKTLAGNAKNIELLGWQSDDVARDHYQRCRAFLFPGLEDFGITPVEAQLCGAPVIAYRAGGATETVVEGKSGVFFNEQTLEGLRTAIQRLEQSTFDENEIRQLALRFTWEHFRQGMAKVVADVLANQPTSAS
jgi:glycosyltransferase involved in cell wall biosynthesis